MSALALNIVWENLHSVLYANYKGGAITEFILVRAALFDALIITVLLLPFLFYTPLKSKMWLFFLLCIAIAIANEWYGLGTQRWAYNALMPVVPILLVGLTPMLQLGTLGVVAYKIQDYFVARFSK